MDCREEDAAIPAYCKDDERQDAQKMPQKAWFLSLPYSIGENNYDLSADHLRTARFRTARRPPAPARSRRILRAGTSSRQGEGAAPHHRKRPSGLHDLLGSARRGENDARPHHRAEDEGEVHRLFRRDERHQRNKTGDERGGKRTQVRRKDHPLRRRDPPLQQGAAGRLSALCRKGQHHPHRRDDGEPLLRSQRGTPFALQGVRLAGVEAGRPRDPSQTRLIRRARLRRAKDNDRRERARADRRLCERGCAKRPLHARNGGPQRRRRRQGRRHRDGRDHRTVHVEEVPSLRQDGRGALQPHFGTAQVHAQFRPRRRRLLAGAHARSGRRPHLHRPPRDPLRLGGRGSCRPAGAAPLRRRIRGVQAHRHARMLRTPHGGRRLHVARPQVQRPLHGV